MSDIDLTEARGVARVAYEKAHFAGLSAVEARAAALDAALPHIERQVREQVAREIEAWHAQGEKDVLTKGAWSEGFRYAVRTAASIARGDS